MALKPCWTANFTFCKFYTVKIGTNPSQRVKICTNASHLSYQYFTFHEICAHNEIICSIHIIFFDIYIWAATCYFQQCCILTSVDSEVPVQPPFKLRTSKWCSVSSLSLIESSSDKQRLWSDCAYAQADLRLCWSHIPHCWKSHATAHIWIGLVLKFWAVHWHQYDFQVTPTPFPRHFCFQWITYSELSLQLLSLKCILKIEKEGLYISALDNAKTVVQ